jgi:hypothetical protein
MLIYFYLNSDIARVLETQDQNADNMTSHI